MFLFTLVLGVLLLPEADNLKCKCESATYGFCSKQTSECFSQYDRCLAATQGYFLGGAKVSEQNYKGCFMSELCLNFSVNNGVFAFLQKSSCCSGDLCNNHIDYPEPDYKSTPNGKKCFSCDGENCMKTLSCVGDENYCVKVTGNVPRLSMMVKGCASKVVCSDHFTSLVNQLASQVPGFFTGAKINCCQGDYCNSASSASPALLLLLVPLLFSNLFS